MRFLPLDLTDAAACEQLATSLPGVTHLVYAALYERPGLVAGWQEREQIETNDRMLRNLLDPLEHAIRRLVEIALKSETSSMPIARPGRRSRAQELARNVIEKMIDPTASPDERAQRRRRLTKGPPEFREDRVDLPKAKGK